jgi:hypothetical protein
MILRNISASHIKEVSKLTYQQYAFTDQKMEAAVRDQEETDETAGKITQMFK